MESKKTSLINDSFLANAVYNLLKQKMVPLSGLEIADKVLDIKNLPPSLADKMVDSILETDARFVRDSNKKWQLFTGKQKNQKLKDLTYIVLDVEIVGSASSPQIIEIAAYRLKSLKITDQYCTFVNPGRPIITKNLPQMSEEKGQIITTEILQKAPVFQQIIADFFNFIKDGILVAHNAHFDLRMINRELKRVGHKKLVNRTIDTLKITRKKIKGIDTQKLPNLAYYFNIPMNQHHLAKEDARVLAKIFPFLIELLADSQIEYLDQMSGFMITP